MRADDAGDARGLPPPAAVLLAAGAASLVAGVWGGLARAGVAGGVPVGTWPGAHGPLMVCGVLGTVIAVERAVALGRAWGWAVPALAAASALALVAGAPPPWPAALATAAAVGLVAMHVVWWRRAPSAFLSVMALGAGAWAGGNALWLAGGAFPDVVPWWMAFLVLTIAGERLELGRVLGGGGDRAMLAAAALVALALAVASADRDAGVRVLGAAFLALAAWMVRYDVARRTVRQRGLARYVAVCLLGGQTWLAVGGTLMVAAGGVVDGPLYDALVHAVLVGFVFSMVFGHAPIIGPAVLDVPVAYHPALYAPLALLHGALALRVAGDVGGAPSLRAWGSVGNAVALALFASVLAGATLLDRRRGVAGR